MKWTFLSFLLAICSGLAPWQVGSERPQKQDPREKAAQKSKELLDDVEAFYNRKGPVGGMFDELEAADKATQKAAKSWTQKSYEAMKGAHRVMVESTKTAQNVLFHDHLRMKGKLKGNFDREMRKLDVLPLTSEEEQIRKKLREEHMKDPYGGVLPLPHQEIMAGMPVLINHYYHGENEDSVHGRRGKIVNFLASETPQKWRVKLDDGNSFEPKLTINEFEVLAHPAVTVNGLDGTEAGHDLSAPVDSEKLKLAMTKYEGQDVRIDNLPLSELPANIKDNPERYMHKIGKVINFDPTAQKYQVRVQDGSQFVSKEDSPWLVEGRDFHNVRELEGKDVTFHKPVETNPLGPGGDRYTWEQGKVEKWNPERQTYTVKLPAQTVELGSHEIQRDRSAYGVEE